MRADPTAQDPIHARPRPPAAARSVTLRARSLVLAAAAICVVLGLLPLLVTALAVVEEDAGAARERYGSTVAERLAASSVDGIIARETLLLAALTREFHDLSGVRSAAVYGADDRLLAAADEVAPTRLERDGDGVFVARVEFQDEIVGYARVALAADALAPGRRGLLVGTAGVLAVVLLALAWFAGERLERRLAALRGAAEARLGETVADDDPLRALRRLLEPEPATTTPPEEAPPPAPRERAAWLVVVNLFNQLELDADACEEALAHCEDLLDLVCATRGGRHEPLPGTGLVLLLDAPGAREDHGFEALCTALLVARVCTGAVAASSAARLRFALERVSADELVALDDRPEPDVEEEEQEDEASGTLRTRLPDAVARTVTLSACAREGTLAVGAAALQACGDPAMLVAHRIESPALRAAGGDGTAWLVAGVQPPAAQRLDRQGERILAEDEAAAGEDEEAEPAPSR
jgi:uncharacterized membrane protein affecting hemolysin expression